MRPDQILVTTQGVRKGSKIHTNLQGNCRIKATKGFNEPENSVWISSGDGKQEAADILIQFSNGQQWNGTFEELQKALQPLPLLEKALETIELLAEEANYTSARWYSEHTEPIEKYIAQLKK